MGYKYYVDALLSGKCAFVQESKQCKSLLGFLITIVVFRFKYPIVNAMIRNGYQDCSRCTLTYCKPSCYSKGGDS